MYIGKNFVNKIYLGDTEIECARLGIKKAGNCGPTGALYAIDPSTIKAVNTAGDYAHTRISYYR